jgi:hypothetical protein
MENNIQRINSIYDKKKVFSYLKYDYFLKIIKYNKLIQNQLGITLQDYKINNNHYDYYIQTIPIKGLKYKFLIKFSEDFPKYLFYLLIFLNFTIFYILRNKIILFILGVILEIIKDGVLKEYNIKFFKEEFIIGIINLIVIMVLSIFLSKIKLISEDVSNKLMLIPKINKGITIYIILILFMLFYFGYIIILKPKKSFLKYINISALLIFFGLNCFYEYLILLKIQILREFDKNNLSLSDYVFLLFNNFILVLSFIHLMILYYLLFPKIIKKYILNTFKNIQIYEYFLSYDFEKIKLKNQYLCKEAKYFNHRQTNEEKIIISSINKYRIENKVQELALIDENIPKFIINDELSEVNLFTHKNLFHLGYEKYLFRYKVGEFVDNLENNKDILLKPNLNRINVIIQNTNALILIYKDNENKNENNKIY